MTRVVRLKIPNYELTHVYYVNYKKTEEAEVHYWTEKKQDAETALP